MAAPDDGSRRVAALSAIVLAVLTWSASNVLIKLVPVPGIVASFWRLWLAVPVTWATVLGVPSVRARMNRRFAVASVAGGALFSVHQILFFSALQFTSVATVCVMGALQPALVLVVSGPLFGERVDQRTVVWTAVAMMGTVLVVVGEPTIRGYRPLGDLLATLNLFAFTAYFLVSKRLRGGVGATEYVCGLTTVAAVLVGAACWAGGVPVAQLTAHDVVMLAIIAVVPGTLGHLLINWAHPHTPAVVTSLLLLGVPVLATAGAAVVLGESVSTLQVIGGATALGAVAALVVVPSREELAEAAAETDAP